MKQKKLNRTVSQRDKDRALDWVKWLLDFENRTNRPVFLTLLIENQQIEFISCVNKNFQPVRKLEPNESEDFEDDEVAHSNITIGKKINRPTSKELSYFG